MCEVQNVIYKKMLAQNKESDVDILLGIASFLIFTCVLFMFFIIQKPKLVLCIQL